MDFISESINNSDFLNFIGIAFSAVVTLWIFKLQRADEFARECHEKLIFPLFDTLEPVLFQQMDNDVLSKSLKIIESNKSFADGKLLAIYYLCKTKPNQENFIKMCAYVNRLFDRSSRKLKLKMRPMNYRILRHQYKRKIYLALYFLSKTLIGLALLFAAFAFTINLIGMVFLGTLPFEFASYTIMFFAMLIMFIGAINNHS